MFVSILHAVPYVLDAALVATLLYGFWQGLTLPLHKEGHRPNRRLHWWWGPDR